MALVDAAASIKEYTYVSNVNLQQKLLAPRLSPALLIGCAVYTKFGLDAQPPVSGARVPSGISQVPVAPENPYFHAAPFGVSVPRYPT